MISKFSSDFKEEEETLSGINWEPFVTEMRAVKDTELVFDSARFYIKKSEIGFFNCYYRRQRTDFHGEA